MWGWVMWWKCRWNMLEQNQITWKQNNKESKINHQTWKKQAHYMEIPCHIQHMIINKCMSFYFSFWYVAHMCVLFYFFSFSFLQYILFKINTNFVCLYSFIVWLLLLFCTNIFFMCKKLCLLNLFSSLDCCCLCSMHF